MVNTARRESGAPLKLGSTWRSPEYNASLGTALQVSITQVMLVMSKLYGASYHIQSGKRHLIKHVLSSIKTWRRICESGSWWWGSASLSSGIRS